MENWAHHLGLQEKQLKPVKTRKKKVTYLSHFFFAETRKFLAMSRETFPFHLL